MSIRNALITTAFAAAIASSTGAMAQSTTTSDPAMSSVPADDGHDDDSGKLGLLGLLGLAGLLGLKRKDDNHNRNSGVGNNR